MPSQAPARTVATVKESPVIEKTATLPLAAVRAPPPEPPPPSKKFIQVLQEARWNQNYQEYLRFNIKDRTENIEKHN